MRHSLLFSVVALVGAGPIGCADADEKGGVFPTSFDVISDGTSPSDTAGTSTSNQDATSPADTSNPADTAEDVRVEVIGPLVSVKADETYLVPGNISEKTEVAIFGTTVAWVERPLDDSGLFFVTWDVASEDALVVYPVANLVDPRQLVLTATTLLYVDDRYGDPDVFGVRLGSGETFSVVTKPGAQEHPAATAFSGGVRVAWQDCRGCASADDTRGSEIYTRQIDLATPRLSPAETRVTDDAVADVHPVFGVSDDGLALGWVRGRSELALERLAGVSARQTFDVASELRASEALGWLAVKPGVLAWRTRPLIVNPDSMIVNPDSMYPTDVFVTDVVGTGLGTTTKLTSHGELREGYEAGLRFADDELAWLESSPTVDRLRVVRGITALEAFEVVGMHDFDFADTTLAFIAPRSDNQGLDDLWILHRPE